MADTVQFVAVPIADIDSIRCVAVVDRTGRVVGTGYTNEANGPVVLALARSAAGGHQLLVSNGRDEPWRSLGRGR
jgi:hypothetical protein